MLLQIVFLHVLFFFFFFYVRRRLHLHMLHLQHLHVLLLYLRAHKPIYSVSPPLTSIIPSSISSYGNYLCIFFLFDFYYRFCFCFCFVDNNVYVEFSYLEWHLIQCMDHGRHSEDDFYYCFFSFFYMPSSFSITSSSSFSSSCLVLYNWFWILQVLFLCSFSRELYRLQPLGYCMMLCFGFDQLTDSFSYVFLFFSIRTISFMLIKIRTSIVNTIIWWLIMISEFSIY